MKKQRIVLKQFSGALASDLAKAYVPNHFANTPYYSVWKILGIDKDFFIKEVIYNIKKGVYK